VGGELELLFCSGAIYIYEVYLFSLMAKENLEKINNALRRIYWVEISSIVVFAIFLVGSIISEGWESFSTSSLFISMLFLFTVLNASRVAILTKYVGLKYSPFQKSK